MEQYVITISRQFGSMGRSIAKELSTLLGIEFMDRDIVSYGKTYGTSGICHQH